MKRTRTTLTAALSFLLVLAGCAVPTSGTRGGASSRGPAEGLGRVAGTNDVAERSTAFLTSYPLGGANAAQFPEAAVDGNPASYWSSFFSDQEWLAVDLGTIQSVSAATLTWERDYGKSYVIEGSTDRKRWNELARKDDGTGGADTFSFTPTSARYVRMRGLQNAGTERRYLLAEFAVQATAGGPNLARGKVTEASSVIWNYFGPDELARAKQDTAAADAHYKAGRYEEAFQAYQRIMATFGVPLLGFTEAYDYAIFDEVRLHMRAADFRRSNPQAKGKIRKRAVMVVVPRVEATMPTAPNSSETVDASRTLREEQVPKIEEGLFWFAESFLAMTNGEVGWDLETIRTDATVTSLQVTFEQATNRFLIWPIMLSLKPAQPEAALKFAAADLPIVLWPGTAKHPSYTVTNGAGHGQYVQIDGRYVVRQAIVTGGDEAGLPFYENNARFFHHELGHWLDGAYSEVAYPKGHGYSRRLDWPGDWEGRSESEFIEQLYRGLLLPADNFARISARANLEASNESGIADFVLQKAGALGGAGSATPQPTAAPTSTPTAEPTAEPSAEPTPVATPTPIPVPTPPPVESTEAENAIDNNSGTHWASGPDDTQWLMLDLGRNRSVGHVQLQWGDDYAHTWVAQVYRNNKWVTVGYQRGGRGGREWVTFTPTTTRYMRLYTFGNSGTNGLELEEFRVHARSSADTNVAPYSWVYESSTR